MSMKTFGDYPIVERGPKRDELQHDWKKHKWLYKEKVNGKTRYFYTEAAHNAFLLSKKGKKVMGSVKDAMVDHLANDLVGQASKSKLVRWMFGGGQKDKRDKASAEATKSNASARAEERAMHETRAKAASANRQYQQLSWREKFSSEGRALKKTVDGLRREASGHESAAAKSDYHASSERKRAAKADKAYKKTTLGQAEAHVRRSQNADAIAERDAKAQDRYDAARSAAKKKRSNEIITSGASVQYQRDYAKEQAEKRRKKR